MTVVEAHAVVATIEARISELWALRQRDRRTAHWSQGRLRREAELRTLVRLVRSGRRMARAAREEAVAPNGTGYHDWQAAGPVTEAELFAGYGMGR